MNLSFSWVLLLNIYLLIRLSTSFNLKQSKTRQLIVFLVVTVVFSAFIHVYYLGILAIMVGSFCLIWGLKELPNWRLTLSIQAVSLGIVLTAGTVVYGFIRWIDAYYSFRRTGAGGYNDRENNLNFDAIYTAYDFNNLPFFAKASLRIPYESYSYLGAFALYSFLIILVLFLVKKGKVERLKRYFLQSKYAWFSLAIIFMGFMGLTTSLGEYARLFNATVNFDNILNPFYLLSRISERFTHFRCIARFNWIFFWGINLGIAFLIGQYYRVLKEKDLQKYCLSVRFC